MNKVTRSYMRQSKPVEEINALLSALLPHSTIVTSRPRQGFNFICDSHAMCYLIEEGSVTIHRSDNSIISTAYAPIILGMGNHNTPSDMGYLISRKSVEIGMISTEKLLVKLNALGMWKELSKLLLFITNQYLQLNLETGASTSSYEKVRTAILALDDEMPEIKQDIVAARYIQDRTGFSRSHVMKIMSDLKKGGYINVKRGVLVHVGVMPVGY